MKEHNMKRIVVLLATLLLSFGLINAGDVSIQFGGAGYESDTLRAFLDAEIQVTWDCDFDVYGASIGLQIYDAGAGPNAGAGWSWVNAGGYGTNGIVTLFTGDGINIHTAMDMTGLLITEQDIDEAARDTLMAGGVAMFTGIPAGGPYHLYDYNFQATIPDPNDEAFVGMLCVDSCFVPPSGAFVFVTQPGQAIASTFSTQLLCAPVTKARNFCPTFDATYGPYSTSHCTPKAFTVHATDPEGNTIQYAAAINTGNGTLGGSAGTFTYTPNTADFGSAVLIDVYAWDPAFHGQMDCAMQTITINVTNIPPTVNCGDTQMEIGMGNPFVKNDIVGGDADLCDVIIYSVALFSTDNPSGVTANAPVINAGTGAFSWMTEIADGGYDYVFEVTVDDGLQTATCQFTVTVLVTDPYLLGITKTHNTLQGHFVDVPITLTKGSENFGGFDFLIGYDASALAFTEAALGDDLVDCGWEYFTYRYNWNGNCGNACPSGLVRVVGLAETNNGPNHPSCFNPGAYPVTIATLTFFVSNDRTLDCMYLPIRFYWMDCGDNTLSSIGGDTLFISRYVYDLEGMEITDPMYGFPGWMGAPDDPCMAGDKATPVRFLDLVNGGIDIVCSDSIDARGDINLNGVVNEIADAVMFTNYFISGLSAFGTHVEGSIAASDVNNDGIALSVADLVYLVRVIVGDANPYPKPMPDALAEINFQHNAISMNAPVNVGAALFTFQVNGEVGTPTLANGITMDMKYAVNGSELRVLVYNIGTNAIPAGDNVIVNVPGNVELVSAEVAAYDGFGIDAMIRNLPASFAVKNFPNPFNPQTTIALDLPVASDWSVKIYNVAGQLVKDYSGYSEAGTLNVVWDGTSSNSSSVASGIYFYKVEASNYSVTKKMMLMK
jgi:hypothetical protein